MAIAVVSPAMDPESQKVQPASEANPMPVLYFPDAHTAHEDRAVWVVKVYVPAGQSRQSATLSWEDAVVATSDRYLPAAQLVQSSALLW